ncbi:alpha-L-arabinofuranosidase C-terminal domain-containing protein [Halomarina rubra]|uniref:non-reducing end alpha-L-arabinofuranosidase n=1 Tax=Halomarina rubra TaxID=2071873 RepID=A0ABD6ASL3_9EURY|nr:alpha-L-arabinofuranosidase C-terminal domain-containing protein [Halomarina rubra]
MVDSDLFTHTPTGDSSAARVSIDTESRASHTVEPMLFGKFSEHLGNNIYQGMDAEILFNPTLGEWHFRAGDRRQSGGFVSENDFERIREEVENHGRPYAYPEETDSEALLDAYQNALAFGWLPVGEGLTFSPDTGPAGNRAQRIELDGDGEAGIRQETRLPLHRTGGYEFRIQLRATDETQVRLTLGPTGDDALGETTLSVGQEWKTHEGTFDLSGEDIDPDGVYEVSLLTEEATNLVVERVLLYPDDHVGHADPDVVSLLSESDLPLLRWPGGNFVSGYDWRDGVGPVDERPERINPAWSGLEPNLFGTDEFIEFCEHVGCEPSICVNAGDGTPEEAAAWVEYCNGSTDTEMGALRAEHGHPEPYDITYWEIGNELYGPWQVNWTTPAGNADRYLRFREVMLETDPSIEVTACGLETNSDGHWNDVLLERAGSDVRAISEHILGGGQVDATTDPDELYHAFMGFSDQLGEEFRDLRGRMEEAGVSDPKLDITELQLFAHFQSGAEEAGREGRHDAADYGDEDATLTPETMPTPVTISEALYNACVRHECIRTGEFVEMLTHSATVNHGGGLWKQGERVWANPCHYGRQIGTAQAEGTPVAVTVESDSISTETTFREIEPVDVPAIDAMATLTPDESELIVMLVNRTSGSEAMDLTLAVDGHETANKASVTTLTGDSMHDANTRAEPTRITPESHTIEVTDGEVALELEPYSMARVTVELE